MLQPRLKDESVSLEGLRPAMILALPVICGHFSENNYYRVVITSGTEKTTEHKKGSKHYIGQALDLRNWHVLGDMELFVASLRQLLGPDFDVILEIDHIHIEYDPKQKERP